MTLKERVAAMTKEELMEALRRTGEGDRTHCAKGIADMKAHSGEGLRVMLEYLPEHEAAVDLVLRRRGLR